MKTSSAESWASVASRQPVYTIDRNDEFHLIRGAETLGRVESFSDLFSLLGLTRPLVVSGSHFSSFPVRRLLVEFLDEDAVFSGYSANPTLEQVLDGVETFKKNGCDGLVSVGGGSAIDVAKCIQAFVAMPPGTNRELFVKTEVPEGLVPHVAIPSTAGTGSESTHFAVVYVDGVKHSVSSRELLPSAAVLDSRVLKGLPDYQKRCTLMDALCQAIESHWSKSSSLESREYSAASISSILEFWHDYLEGNESAAHEIMNAANLAGKAINLTTTTAPHAMSYKLTSLYGIAHGHAVAVCLPVVWERIIERCDSLTAERLAEISEAMGAKSNHDALSAFRDLLGAIGLDSSCVKHEDVAVLAASVNIQRLRNSPVAFDEGDLKAMYEALILRDHNSDA